MLPEWNKFALGKFKKLDYVVKASFNDMDELSARLEGYDAFFCALGTSLIADSDNFMKVDYVYPYMIANIAKDLNIAYYGLLSCQGSDKESAFVYLRTKGSIEDICATIGLRHLAIYKPAIATSRKGDFSLLETLSLVIPFLPGVEAATLGNCIIKHSVDFLNSGDASKNFAQGVDVLTNEDINAYCNEGYVRDSFSVKLTNQLGKDLNIVTKLIKNMCTHGALINGIRAIKGKK